MMSSESVITQSSTSSSPEAIPPSNGSTGSYPDVPKGIDSNKPKCHKCGTDLISWDEPTTAWIQGTLQLDDGNWYCARCVEALANERVTQVE